ncbi:MAG: hypothetical protein R3A79_29025 [Nannocystaceae bacterium]
MLDPLHLANEARSAAEAAAALRLDPELLAATPRPRQRWTRQEIDGRALRGDDAAARRLLDALYAASARLVDARRDAFVDELLPAAARRTTICVYRDHAGAVVGHLACHTYVTTVDAAPTVILCGDVRLPQQAIDSSVAAFFAKETARALLGRRGRRLYFVGALLDPAAYAQLYRLADDRIWPRPACATPPAIDALRVELAAIVGLGDRTDDSAVRELERRRLWDDDELARWRQHPRPEVHYFVGRNPGYDRGQGLLTLIEISAAGLLRGLLRGALEFGGRGLRRALGRRPRALPPARSGRKGDRR